MIKIKLSVHPKNKSLVEDELIQHGIVIDPHAPYELIERTEDVDYLPVKDDRGDKMNIPIESIIFLESFGRNVAIHTSEDIYTSNERMYQLEEFLLPKGFLRVSNSIIVSRRKITKIRHALSSKFVLTMSDASLVDVTRSYYNQFRQEMGL